MEIKLIPADPKYAEIFMTWRQDPKMIKYNPLAPSTLDQIRDRLTQAGSDLSKFDLYDSFFWMISYDGALVGHVSLNNVNKMMLTTEIGYGVALEARGKGVAKAAVKLAIQNVFAQSPIRKIIGYVAAMNVSSIKVLENLGFKKEGHLREHYLINGHPTDELMFGLLRSEFRS